MRLLILGGTAFLGRATARHALAAGHDVTCAARGTGAPVDGVTFVEVDRDHGLDAVTGDFDAVIDVARRPSHVRSAVAALDGRVGHWGYVSSCSVYADQATPGQLATAAPLLAPAPPELDSAEGESYGPCKVACEEAVLAASAPAFLCRAGLIVGPEDPSGRFDYWVSRLARGGEILAPGEPGEPVQWIDARDLAAWLVHAAETGLAGAFDGIGAPVTRADFLAGIADGIGAQPRLTYVTEEFLTGQGIQTWFGERSLPMWLPMPDYAGFLARDVSPALAAGLTPRSLADTARDTLGWLGTGPELAKRCGIEPADEAEVLRAWHAR